MIRSLFSFFQRQFCFFPPRLCLQTLTASTTGFQCELATAVAFVVVVVSCLLQAEPARASNELARMFAQGRLSLASRPTTTTSTGQDRRAAKWLRFWSLAARCEPRLCRKCQSIRLARKLTARRLTLGASWLTSSADDELGEPATMMMMMFGRRLREPGLAQKLAHLGHSSRESRPNLASV